MFRFKLRTLLIATALVGLFLGLQVYVHNKAKRFGEEVNHHGPPTSLQFELIKHASLDPPTLTDVLLLRRRCTLWTDTIQLRHEIGSFLQTGKITCFGGWQDDDPDTILFIHFD